MAHSREAHATKAAMPQFNLGHWEKKSEPVTAGDGRYNAGEFSQAEEYRQSVDALVKYRKTHKAKH